MSDADGFPPPRGCTCEYGCPNCGYALNSMGNCPAWGGCPVGRERDPACPVHPTPEETP